MANERCLARAAKNMEIKQTLLNQIEDLCPVIIGKQSFCLPHVLSFAIPGVDSEAAILALKGIVAISNGSACTSSSHKPSHVLKAMQLSEEIIDGALRFSWCHMTPEIDFAEVATHLKKLL